jgi:hypothetical protein
MTTKSHEVFDLLEYAGKQMEGKVEYWDARKRQWASSEQPYFLLFLFFGFLFLGFRLFLLLSYWQLPFLLRLSQQATNQHKPIVIQGRYTHFYLTESLRRYLLGSFPRVICACITV